jgi:hypothetical protein
MATAEQLNLVQKAVPFRAYEIRLADGREYRVPHPEHLAIDPRPRARSAVFFEPKGRNMHLIDLGLIAEIITEAPAEAVESEATTE